MPMPPAVSYTSASFAPRYTNVQLPLPSYSRTRPANSAHLPQRSFGYRLDAFSNPSVRPTANAFSSPIRPSRCEIMSAMESFNAVEPRGGNSVPSYGGISPTGQWSWTISNLSSNAANVTNVVAASGSPANWPT